MGGNMSEYDELVRRLRHDADAVNQPGGTLSPEHWRDAAYAIEALVGEVAALTHDIAKIKEDMEHNTQHFTIALHKMQEQHTAERCRLKSALDRAGNPQLPRPASAYVEMRDERDALKAEVERLKGVLVGVIDFIGSEEWREAHTALEQIVNRIRKALEAKP